LALTLGIDPGSRITGFGVLKSKRSSIEYAGSGVIKTDTKKTRPERLRIIKISIDRVIEQYSPDSIAVEEIFIAKNPKSVLKLGEARGIVLLSAAEHGIPVHEYSPREVKMSVVGTGSAHKSQVAAMIVKLLKLEKEPGSDDETDALAVAFCHENRKISLEGRLP